MIEAPRRLLWSFAVAAALSTLGCATGQPRFDPVVAAGLAQEPMRRIETPRVRMYYPASHRAAAVRIAARLDACVAALRAKARPVHEQDKVLVYLTLANFNNAFVQAEYLGFPLQMVLPIHTTLETDNFLDFGTVNEGDTACHEALHYIQNQQTHGFWSVVNAIAGATATPSQGLERWFTEGLAVWTEGHMGLDTARPASPFWYGVFEGTVQARDYRLQPGDLSIETRDIYGSGAYLVGYFFIDYLVHRYGEEKLWKLIDLEGGSIFFPFGTALRFRSVYGETLGELFDDFSQKTYVVTPRRVRPPEQHVLISRVGAFARLATSPADGAMAVASDGYDTPPLLTVYARDGAVRFRKALTWLAPVRPWIDVTAGSISGMRFSADGRQLFLVASGLSSRGDDVARLWELDASTGSLLRSWPLQGFGGDLSPDGTKYLYVEIASDHSNLVELDLKSGRRRHLTHLDPLRSLGSPSYSPDGHRIVFPLWDGENFDLALRTEDGHISMLTTDGRSNYGPRWLDDHRLVFLRELDNRWQLHLIDTQTGAIQAISDVPHLAIDPMVGGNGRVVFLDRDGVSFSVDSVPVPLLPKAPPRVTGKPIEPLPLVAAPPVSVLRDEPSHWYDQFFIPSLHTPFVQFRIDPVHGFVTTAGISIWGSDRLGYHNYALNLWIDTLTKEPSFTFDYLLNRYAPYLAAVHLTRVVSESDDVFSDYREASLSVSRSFWDTPVALSFVGLQQLENITGRTQLIGPGLAASYDASEVTPYAGIRRGFRLGASAHVFPAGFGSSLTMGDLRGTFGFTVPLPFSPRHTLSLDLVAHALPGATPGLLEVGGYSPAYTWYLAGACQQQECFAGSGGPLPGDVYLTEPLEGYEDFIFLTTRTVIASAHYLYPLVIDRGLTSFLYILPSVWVSQVNLRLFGTWAWIDPDKQARATGFTVSLATLWGSVFPINVAYSFEYRFDEHLKPLSLITLGY